MLLCFFSEGRTAADTYNARHMEVSAILNHRVDDLLVNSLKEVRITVARRRKNTEQSGSTGSLDQGPRNSLQDPGCLQKAKDNVIGKLLKTSKCGASRSCENLVVL